MTYRCTNGLCGALDCERCHPEYADDSDEARQLDNGDQMRDEALEDDMSTEMLAGIVHEATARSANANS